MKSESLMLKYISPASNWDEALPVGNGRIGGMVFGEVKRETIQLNEDSVWSGKKRARNNPQALENLQRVRELLFEEKISEAEAIVNDAFCGTTTNCRHYMPLCDLIIEQEVDSYDNYQRTLDLENAVCKTVFSSGGVTYTREVIASHPANALIVNMKADKANAITLKMRLDGRDDYFDDYKAIENGIFRMEGSMGELYFTAHLGACSTDGEVKNYGNFIIAQNCSEVTILVTAHTSYRTLDSYTHIKDAIKKDFESLKNEHINDYREYFDRVKFTLCKTCDNNLIPTNERLLAVKNGNDDNELVVLYHAFARYLLISGSREGTLPLNLQGIWNKDMWPAWGGRFTVNINAQMNYWCAETLNLSSLHTPLFDLLKKVRENGRETAKVMYDCRGFCCHHNTDLWGDTAPQDLWMPATQWPMGAAWLCTHIWEHYKFTQDKEFLKEKMDTLLEAALFFEDFLIEDKKGRLVTAPSVSPENTYITKSGSSGCLCIGPSMDSQIIYELFTACIEGCEILGDDRALHLIPLREKLPKPEIGKYGQIMEWAEDYDEAEPGHRHISQLFALYPADMISKIKTPALADAARATLDRRLTHGGGHTGWSRAWIINLFARLYDGEKVYENVKALLSHSTNPNLFDSHPPFQIDGNFGGAAGITEALLQSNNGILYLLPALPKKWSSGEFSGFMARGNFEVAAKWDNGRLTEAQIISKSGSDLNVMQGFEFEAITDGERFTSLENSLSIKTKPNQKIIIKPIVE